MINASGFKVWPAEVESLLYQHPAVQEACVIAARDSHRGETVKAVVVLKPRCARQSIGQDIIGWASKENGRVQVSAHRRVRRCAAEIGHRQSAVAPAAGAREQPAGERVAAARPSGRQN